MSLNRVKVSEHLWLDEIECRGGSCCGYAAKIYPECVDLFEETRRLLSEHRGMDSPVGIESAYRCPVHNRDVGGRFSSLDPRDPFNSSHVRGQALDPRPPRGVPKSLLARMAVKAGWPRVGLYWKMVKGKRILVLHCDIMEVTAACPAVWGDGWPEGRPGWPPGGHGV